MPTAWFLDTYRRAAKRGFLWSREPTIVDFIPQISADGGKAAWVEIADNQCLVYTRASTATLAAISAVLTSVLEANLRTVMGTERSTPHYNRNTDELTYDGPRRPLSKTLEDVIREVG